MRGRSYAVLLALTVLFAGVAHGSPYADYIPSGGYYYGAGTPPADFLTGDPYDDPTTALGRPTVDTTGFYPAFGDPANVSPVNSPWRSTELVSVGIGGYLTVGFDDPILNDPLNPYGLDFIVFGNTFMSLKPDAQGSPLYWGTADDPSTRFVDSTLNPEPLIVSVSQDGSSWYSFDQVFADTWAPTLGRVYNPANPDTGLGSWNMWWGGPTDPTVPLDPALTLTGVDGWSVAALCAAYGVSAGGTAFDLDWLGIAGLDWVRYLRIDNPDSSAVIGEIDAFADVAPLSGSAPIPEPATAALLLFGCGAVGPLRRLRHRRT